MKFFCCTLSLSLSLSHSSVIKTNRLSIPPENFFFKFSIIFLCIVLSSKRKVRRRIDTSRTSSCFKAASKFDSQSKFIFLLFCFIRRFHTYNFLSVCSLIAFMFSVAIQCRNWTIIRRQHINTDERQSEYVTNRCDICRRICVPFNSLFQTVRVNEKLSNRKKGNNTKTMKKEKKVTHATTPPRNKQTERKTCFLFALKLIQMCVTLLCFRKPNNSL